MLVITKQQRVENNAGSVRWSYENETHFLRSSLLENRSQQQTDDPNIMRICTANLWREGNLVEDPFFDQNFSGVQPQSTYFSAALFWKLIGSIPILAAFNSLHLIFASTENFVINFCH